MATSGKQLSSLPSASSIAGNNEFLTWVGNDTAQKVSRDDFIKSLPTYRQPSTAYTAGQIAYHSTLPTGWYLECTTAGTTGSGALTISTTTIGTTLSDGTVVWTISRDLSVSGGKLIDSVTNATIFRRVNNDGEIAIYGGTGYNQGAQISLAGKNATINGKYGAFKIVTHNETDSVQLVGASDGSLIWGNNNDLAGSAIVAKSIGANGYIKYASGLIIQWGHGIIDDNSQVINGNYRTAMAFPINFSTIYSITGSITSINGASLPYVSIVSADNGNAYIGVPVSQLSNTVIGVDYIAIGV